MKHILHPLLGKFSVFVVIVLGLSISQDAWGLVVKTNTDHRIYIDLMNQSGWTSDIGLTFGNSSASIRMQPTQVANTKLWYQKLNTNWTDLSWLAVYKADWGTSQGQGYSDYSKWIDADKLTAQCTQSYTFGDGSTDLITVASGSDHPAATITYIGGWNDYTKLNYTQTIRAKVSTNGGSSYFDVTSSPAILTIKSYEITGDGETGSQQTTNLAVGGESATRKAARTATTTLSYSSVSSGYTFQKWIDEDGNTLSTTYYPTQEQTIYACFTYTEPTYNVSVVTNNSTYGSVEPAQVSAGSVGKADIKATANSCYYFINWTGTTGITFDNDASATTKVAATQTGTATANFAERWVLRGSRTSDGSPKEGMPGWNTTTDIFTNDGKDHFTKTVTLLPNREYKFMIYDKKDKAQRGYKTANQTLTAGTQSGSMDGTYHLLMNTAGYGTYTFTVVDNDDHTYPQITITNPASYQISMGKVGDGKIEAKTTETIESKTTDFEITDGKYVREGGSVTFTATPGTGYQIEGWYTTAACTAESKISAAGTNTTYTESDIKAAKTIYVKFTKINYNITYPGAFDHYSINEDRPKTGQYQTSPSFTVTPNKGYLVDVTASHGSAPVDLQRSGNTYTIKSMPADNVTINIKSHVFKLNGITGAGEDTTFDANWQFSTELTALTTYQLKLHNTAAGLSNNGYFGNSGTIESTITKGWTMSDTESSKLTLKTGIAGTYTFTYCETEEGGVMKPQIKVTYPQVSKLTFGGKDYAFSQVGESGVWVAGPLSLAAGTSYENNIQMIWEGTCIKNDNDQCMTVSSHTDWGMKRYTSGTYYIKIATQTDTYVKNPDNYYFYYKPDTKKLTAEYPSYWRGSDLGWGCNHPMKFTNDIATIVVDVQTSGDREMKVVVDGQYWTNTDAAITTSTNNIQFEKDANKDKAAFKYNVASSMLGNYTFTFNRSTHMMNVAYPDAVQYSITYTDAEGTKTILAGPNGGKAIKAADKPGYKFTGWVIGPVDDKSYITVSGDDKSQQTTTVYGHKDGGSITATYTNTNFIYFKNIPGWSDVYVYFYTEGYFDNDKGSGTMSAGSRRVATGYHMTHIGKTDIWYFDYSSHMPTTGIVAFSDQYQNDAQWFDQCQVVYRGDFGDCAPMMVPINYIDKYLNKHNNKQTCYYQQGHWMKYDAAQNTSSGIELHIYSYNESTKKWEDITNSPFALKAETNGSYSFASDPLTLPQGNYIYHMKLSGCSAGKTWYGNGGDMTSTNCTNWVMSVNSDDTKFHSTTAGPYTFRLSTGNGQLKLSAEYPLSDGDYRVIHTNSIGTYTNDLTYKGHRAANDTASFYYNTNESSPVFKVQKCTNAAKNEWADAANGIFTKPSATGVYNFVFTHDGEGNVTEVITPALYTGNYYIRTARANGGWESYKANPDNLMEYSEFAKDNSGYDYVVCYWTESGKDVAYTIANDYSKCISDTLKDDAILGTGVQTLPANANVRFTWNSQTNALGRAYLSGSAIASDRYLVMTDISQQGGLFQEKMYDAEGNSLTGEYQVSGLNAHEVTFVDKNNWVYQVDVKANPTATVNLTANYNGADRSLKENDTIIGGTYTDTKKFTLRTIYNFKTNNLITALIPDEHYDNIETINADVMIIREHHKDAAQVTFATNKKLDQVKTVYGVMSFDKDILNNSALSEAERSLYWISFPYDVKLNEVFGIGTYGTHWIIEYYDGAGRAKNGFWSDSETNWKFVWDRTNYVLKANMGYVLALDLEQFGNSSTIWNNGVTEANLYFPSATPVSTITGDVVSVKLDSLPCTITRDNRNIWDSNWNLIGVPSYANRDSLKGYDLTDAEITKNLNFYYNWDPKENKLTAAKAADKSFKAMYAYLVQYAGTIDWTKTRVDTFLVARRAAAPTTYTLQLHVAEAEKEADHLFVEFNDEYSTYFDMNKDLTKASNAGTNLYSIVEEVHVAANCLPLESGSNLVPVGIKADKKATYTFSMPQGTQGLDVQLYDIEDDTYTNLSLGNYEVYLNAGTYDDRFVLVITRSDVSTQIQQTEANGQVVKMIRNNQLYIVRDGVVYDAIGKRIEK